MQLFARLDPDERRRFVMTAIKFATSCRATQECLPFRQKQDRDAAKYVHQN